MTAATETAQSFCRICGLTPTIRSHLIPQAFVKALFHDGKGDETHMLIHPDEGYKQPSTTGRYAQDILCAMCDGVLGFYENAALRLFKRLRSTRVGHKTGAVSHINAGIYPFRVADENELIRFACGILWKYASLSSTTLGHIDIGRHKEICAKICFDRAEILNDIDVFIERDLLSFAAFTDPADVYYYSTPSVGVRAGLPMAWFSVGGFIVWIKLDQHVSDYAPKRCWLRNRKQCYFFVSPRSLKTNESMHASIGATKGDLARLNRKVLVARGYAI